MKLHLPLFLSCCLIFASYTVLFAQTNPEPHPLRATNYIFTGLTTGDDVYPPSMQGWSGTQYAIQTSAPTNAQADGDEPLCTTCLADNGGSSINNQGSSGINIRRMADNNPGRPLAIVIAINTIGCTGIKITWTAAVTRGNDLCNSAIQLQYRTGTSGNWTNVQDHNYIDKPIAETFGPTTLPAALDGKAVVQLRWILYAINNNTTTDRHRIDEVTIEPTTRSTFPVAKFDFITANDTATFTDQSLNTPASWFWDFGDGITSTDQHPQHIYAGSGAYNVKLRVQNAIGVDSVTKQVTIDKQVLMPEADFDFIATALDVAFEDLSTNAPASWEWDFGDSGTSTDQNPSHTYAAAGTYDVRLIAFNSAGSDTIIKPVSVTASVMIPEAAFSFIENNRVVDFTDESQNYPTSWEWDFGDGGTSALEDPQHTYTTDSTFNVCLIATNTAGSDTVCHDVLVKSGIGQLYEPGLNIYPNPGSGMLTLEMPELSGTAEVQVISLLGETIRLFDTDSKILQMDLRKLDKGSYFIRVHSNGKIYTSKVNLID